MFKPFTFLSHLVLLILAGLGSSSLANSLDCSVLLATDSNPVGSNRFVRQASTVTETTKSEHGGPSSTVDWNGNNTRRVRSLFDRFSKFLLARQIGINLRIGSKTDDRKFFFKVKSAFNGFLRGNPFQFHLPLISGGSGQKGLMVVENGMYVLGVVVKDTQNTARPNESREFGTGTPEIFQGKVVAFDN